MEALGLECKCLGGGKIEHNSAQKQIRVFGESTVSVSLNITYRYIVPKCSHMVLMHLVFPPYLGLWQSRPFSVCREAEECLQWL